MPDAVQLMKSRRLRRRAGHVESETVARLRRCDAHVIEPIVGMAIMLDVVASAEHAVRELRQRLA